MSTAEIKKVCIHLKLGRKLKHQKTVKSSVTTQWGVEWDDEMVARDLMQNFFDANRQFVSKIRISSDGTHALVSAPAQYQLERLFYLGSEKGDEDVGQYGEGFKAAAVCLLRKYSRALLLATSGSRLVWITLDAVPVQETNLYPLVYKFYHLENGKKGSHLVVRNTSSQLTQAIDGGLTHFFYAGNPLIGQELETDDKGEFKVFAATTDDGHIFYRHLKRGDIPGVPLCLVLKKEYKQIEKKIRSDRDRNAFGEELRTSFYKVWARSFFATRFRALAVLEAARPLWQRGEGHPLLSEIARRRPYITTDDAKALFGDSYFARSQSRNLNEQLRFQQIEETWIDEGRIQLPTYFESFGVISARAHAEQMHKRAREEAARNEHRQPTPAENTCIRLLSDVVRSLAPHLMVVFDARRTVYSIAETDVVLGELKQARYYGKREVYLAAVLFDSDFARALAVFLHEHAHIFGYDGSREFTDALTEIIETVVRSRQTLDQYERQWNSARTKVVRERRRRSKSLPSPADRLAAMKTPQLRALLERIPDAYLHTLLFDGEAEA